MYDLKTILLAKRFRRNLDITHLTIADIAMLEIIKNKTSGNPVRDATISNGIAYFDRVSVSQPLVSLKLNIPVTQQGSGTPSPDNIRDIVGVQGVTIGQTSGYGKYFKGLLNGTYGFVDLGDLTWSYNSSNDSFIGDAAGKTNGADFISQLYSNSGYVPISSMPDMTAQLRTSYLYVKNSSYNQPEPFKTAMSGVYLIYELAEPSTPVTPEQFATLCQAFGITGNTYQITFGQTVYSAILDVLTGKLYATHELKTIDENSDITMSTTGTGIFYLNDFFEIEEDTESINSNLYQRAENRSSVTGVINNNPDYSFCCKLDTYNTRILIKDTRFTSVEDYKTWLSTNPVKIAVKLAEPIEIDLTPTQIITTLIGENVIFADVANVTECKYTRK